MPEVLAKYSIKSFSALAILVSIEENSFISSSKSLVSWGARWALKELMIDLGIDAERLIFGENTGPQDSLREYSFSISHSFPFCAAIISKKPVGIDLEKQGRNVEKILSKFLKEEELNLIKDGSIDGLEAFCMKEAALKTAKGKIKTLKEPIFLYSKERGGIQLDGKFQGILFEKIKNEKCLMIASCWETTH